MEIRREVSKKYRLIATGYNFGSAFGTVTSKEFDTAPMPEDIEKMFETASRSLGRFETRIVVEEYYVYKISPLLDI